jgi:hypothetical protein
MTTEEQIKAELGDTAKGIFDKLIAGYKATISQLEKEAIAKDAIIEGLKDEITDDKCYQDRAIRAEHIVKGLEKELRDERKWNDECAKKAEKALDMAEKMEAERDALAAQVSQMREELGITAMLDCGELPDGSKCGLCLTCRAARSAERIIKTPISHHEARVKALEEVCNRVVEEREAQRKIEQSFDYQMEMAFQSYLMARDFTGEALEKLWELDKGEK